MQHAADAIKVTKHDFVEPTGDRDLLAFFPPEHISVKAIPRTERCWESIANIPADESKMEQGVQGKCHCGGV